MVSSNFFHYHTLIYCSKNRLKVNFEGMGAKPQLGIKTYITIGDRYWSEDNIYCEMSYENIRSELASPDAHNTIDAHVWLTLTDGTILDFTSEAHIDVMERRGCFPANECFQVIQKSQPVVGYHRPFLVGFDFLFKTGCIQL